MADELQVVLSKIRPHTSSSLPHQKAPATLLHAIESTFNEQNAEKSPTAYFAALLTTLDGTLQTARTCGPALGDGDILPAELYLLALVVPLVPHPVIRSNLDTIITLTAPLFPALVPHAPPLRSQLSLYAAVLSALDRSQLETHGLRQSFGSILHLCLDPRPKVRKRAAELVRDVLSNPPAPLLRHPYADRVAEWVILSLNEMSEGGMPKFKGKKAETEGSDGAIHLLAFLRPVLSTLPPSSLPTITTSLLALPRLGNPYLSQSAYSILTDLLAIPMDDPTNNVQGQISDILKAVLSSPPSKTDSTLVPAWADVLGGAMLAYRAVDAEISAAKIPGAWGALWPFLESSDATIRKAAAKSLDSLSKCFTPSLIGAALKEKANNVDSRSTLGKIIGQTEKALDSLAFARAMPELLGFVSSLITNLRYRDGPRSSPTAAESLLMPLILRVGALRIQKGFEFKEAADATLSTAMHILGPEVLLRELPLNLEAADRQAGREPRAFLLPMLAQPHPSPLTHFLSYFVPLTERMFDLQQKAESEGRQSEAKVWNVLVNQIWTGLHGYCWGTVDLKEALTPEFSQLLSQLLYTQDELRPAVLRAMKILVESNVAFASGNDAELATLPVAARENAISQEGAAANVSFLRTQAESWLAVLFNLFSSVGRDGQGMVGDVISAWTKITDEKDITKAYSKLVILLQQNLAKAQPMQGTNGPKDGGNIAAVTQDLLVLLIPFLSPTDASALFELSLSSEVLESKDNAVQKRGYKILAKLVEGGRVTLVAESVLQRLEALVDGLAPAAKKDRFQLLSLLTALIPSSSMHLIPSIIPEAVLGTKEPSEKARLAAFDLVVSMGKKMAEGGVVRRHLVDGMDEGGEGEATASIEEYMTMIAGGLAGATPHMISATVTAISRLIFEFKEMISFRMHSDIFATLLVFLSSANREIVKSTLGYVKLAIHTMPVSLLHPHLKELIPALLKWSHDHKNHFKAKVRHIFERLIRRFGWEDVYACAGEDDARKVLLNVKKRKDRAKRKKARNAEEEEEEEGPSHKPAAGDAFEDVLYGSESELEDSDDDVSAAPASSGRHAKRQGGITGARLRMDNDEPVDLLSGVASRITNSGNRKQRKPGQDATHFKTDEDTGKMVIDQDNGDDADATMAGAGGDAYRESLTSVDGFTRGPNGRVKFNKDTKKRRRENDDAGEDVEMGDADNVSAGKKNKRRADVRLGHEFKAKKAGGDVKKGGVDPYAYLPLSQAAKKKGRRERVGVAGKR